MCNWEEYLFSCGCSTFRLQSYCHMARNDPNHECLSVKFLRDVWEQPGPCEKHASSVTGGQSTGSGNTQPPNPPHHQGHQERQGH